MSNARMLGAILISALILQSCSVSYLELKNELKENALSGSGYGQPCDIRFYIKLTGYRVRAKPGPPTWMYLDSFHEDRLREYIVATQQLVRNKGCTASYVEHEEEANLRIQIARLRVGGTAPQDYLTGLSFGLIPSWKTVEGAREFSFENVSEKKKHYYTVDQKTFAHLILFPIFWVTFLTLDDMSKYENALTNFLNHS